MKRRQRRQSASCAAPLVGASLFVLRSAVFSSLRSSPVVFFPNRFYPPRIRQPQLLPLPCS